MNMVENDRKKKRAGIPPRNKQTHAQFVWIRQLYCEIDEIKVRLDKLENRKPYKEESEQSNGVTTP
jgi:hypothetical protein